MSDDKCNEFGCCRLLQDRVVDGGKGFKAFHTVDRRGRGSRVRFLGVAYKTSERDKGLLLNFCPWCGGKPGYFERDAPATTGAD